MSESACVRECVHMHVFCISMEEYAQHRKACRLPSRAAFFPSPLCRAALVSLLLPHLSRAQPSEVYRLLEPDFFSSKFLPIMFDVKEE